MKRAAALLLPLAAFGLQGCVLAAAAIPVIATGAMVGKQVFGERTREAIAEGNPFEADAVDLARLGDFTVLATSELPAPTVPVPSTGPLADLLGFAGDALPTDETSFSALLANPAELRPTRAACEAQAPAVLIDLDPADGLVPLEASARPDPALVTLIGQLRAQGIAIAWITDREPTEAGAIRDRLDATGLDPTRRDPLFVQRFPGEVKQRRRRALLETHCVLAIAGDDRRDFDDLYIYLRDPTHATSLEPMIGEGWFLIPNPLD